MNKQTNQEKLIDLFKNSYDYFTSRFTATEITYKSIIEFEEGKSIDTSPQIQDIPMVITSVYDAILFLFNRNIKRKFIVIDIDIPIYWTVTDVNYLFDMNDYVCYRNPALSIRDAIKSALNALDYYKNKPDDVKEIYADIFASLLPHIRELLGHKYIIPKAIYKQAILLLDNMEKSSITSWLFQHINNNTIFLNVFLRKKNLTGKVDIITVDHNKHEINPIIIKIQDNPCSFIQNFKEEKLYRLAEFNKDLLESYIEKTEYKINPIRFLVLNDKDTPLFFKYPIEYLPNNLIRVDRSTAVKRYNDMLEDLDWYSQAKNKKMPKKLFIALSKTQGKPINDFMDINILD